MTDEICLRCGKTKAEHVAVNYAGDTLWTNVKHAQWGANPLLCPTATFELQTPKNCTTEVDSRCQACGSTFIDGDQIVQVPGLFVRVGINGAYLEKDQSPFFTAVHLRCLTNGPQGR